VNRDDPALTMLVPPRILFVCLGNICRSPLAEGAFRALLSEQGRTDVRVDSAGTGAWHAGEPPDPRSVAEARRRGVDITGQRARQLRSSDFADFDWIVAMDDRNLADAEARAPRDGRARLIAFRELLARGAASEVPDPYYGGPDGFRQVWELLAAGMPALLARVDGEGDGGERAQRSRDRAP
jgi:protein-tyrosine phosphatase